MAKILSFLIIFFLKLMFNVIICQQYLITYPTSNKHYLTKYYSLYTSNKFDTRMSNLHSAKIMNCTDPSLHCYGNGICSTFTNNLGGRNCTCNYGFATLDGSYYQCGYARKKALYALLLEICPSFGFGHLYIQRYELFIAKLVSFIFFCYLIFCIMIFIGSINESNVNEDTIKRTEKILMYFYPFIYAWYLFDIVVYTLNKYKDKNSMDLLPIF